MFLETLSFNNWYSTRMDDFYYKSKEHQQKHKASIHQIPFFEMPYEMLQYLIDWFKIPTTIYKWKQYPYASYIQWLSRMESVFLYVFVICT